MNEKAYRRGWVISKEEALKNFKLDIPDRYDNDFRSSNYFESTYDVDGLKKKDKESTLG